MSRKEKMREFYRTYGLNQLIFSKITGVSDGALRRYENSYPNQQIRIHTKIYAAISVIKRYKLIFSVDCEETVKRFKRLYRKELMSIYGENK